MKPTRRVARTASEVEELARRVRDSELFGFDSESSGPALIRQNDPTKTRNFVNMYRATLTGCSFHFPEDNKSIYLPIGHRTGNASPRAVQQFMGQWRQSRGTNVAHNIQHELLALRDHVSIADLDLEDTLIIHWLLNYDSGNAKSPYGLKALAPKYCNIEMSSFNDVVGEGTFADLTPEQGLDYACEDAEVALWLYKGSKGHMDAFPGMEHGYRTRELPFIHVLRRMQDTGFPIDRDYFETYARELEAQLGPLLEEWAFLTKGININSGTQLQALYEDGHWPTADVPKTARGYSTAAEYVRGHATSRASTPLGRVLAEIRLEVAEASKLLSTYTDKMIYLADQYPDGRLHTDVHHTGTATGRISSSYPNLTNIPTRTEAGAKLLNAFVAPEGFDMLSADYSQIELRVMAHRSQDPRLLHAYRNGLDIHQVTADAAEVSRANGKTLNFAVGYGAGPRKLTRAMGLSYREAKAAIDRFWAAYPLVVKSQAEDVAFADKHGYVRTLGGRIRRIPELHMSGHLRWAGERKAKNTPIQGSAADIVKQAMVDLYRELPEFDMAIQVHDDLIGFIPETSGPDVPARLKEIMESCWKLSVPLLTEPSRGKTWKDVK